MTEENQDLEADGRHPFRFLLKFAMFVGLIYVVGRFLAQKKNEYAGLTESQARDKFVDKISPKVGEETATEIADQVIPKLRERGFIKPDSEAGSDSGQSTDDASDEVSEAVDSVVKD